MELDRANGLEDSGGRNPMELWAYLDDYLKVDNKWVEIVGKDR